MSKIYKLVNKINNDIYVGKTILSLLSRLQRHKANAKIKPSTHVYVHLNKVGWNNISIELFVNPNDVYKRERYWIDTLNPYLNVQKPLRTTKEWYHDNREKILENKKIYYQEKKLITV